MLALLRRDPLLAAVFVVLWICTLVPLWGSRFLPLLDLPNHIDAIAIWHRFHDPTWKYEEFYTLNLKPVPYWGYFFPVHMMAYVMPIEVANKIYLSAYALALPLGALALAAQMGRSPWLSIFAFPLVFNMNFMFGFITCSVGMAVLLWSLWALDRYLQAPSRGRAVALALLAMGLYFTHILPWLFFGVSAGVLLVSHGWQPRRIAWAAALMMPSVAMALIGFRVARDGTTPVVAGSVGYEPKYEKFTSLLSEAPTRILTAWTINDQAFMMLLVITALWLMVLVSGRPADDPERRGAFRFRLEVVFLLALLAAFTLPVSTKKPVDLWMIGGRFVSVAALLGALLPHGLLDGRRRWLMVPVVAIAVWYPLKLHQHWRRFDQRAACMRRLMTRVPRGSSTLVLVTGDPGDPDADPQAVPYVQFHSYAQYLSGGFNPWALQIGFPMLARKDKRLPAPTWKSPHSFRFDEHGVHYDYILTMGETLDYTLFGPDDAGRAPLVGHDGAWRLYRVGR